MNQSPIQLGTHFIGAGIKLFIFGLVMSLGMIAHYIVGSKYPNGASFLSNVQVWFACPWTLSTAVVLLGAVGMIAIGGAYATLARAVADATSSSADRVALQMCIWSLIAIFLTGYAGYFVVDAFAPGFYYFPLSGPKNVWVSAQLACVVAYMAAVCMISSGFKRLTQAVG